MSYNLTHMYGLPKFEANSVPKITFFREGLEFKSGWKKYFIEYSKITDYTIDESEENIKKGWSTGKAIGGAVLTGGIGLLAGFIGSNKDKKKAFIGLKYLVNGMDNKILFKIEDNLQLAYNFINDLSANRLGNPKLKLYFKPQSSLSIAEESNNYTKTVNLIICLLLGWFGVHRFMRGDILIGVIYIFTVGGFGFGVLLDAYLIYTNNW